jgi:hypothetical protein
MGRGEFLMEAVVDGGASNAKRFCAFGFARFELQHLIYSTWRKQEAI